DVRVDALVDAVGADILFWRAVIAVDWLRESTTGLEVPRAEEWLTRGAKARLQKTKRQSLWRAGKADVDGRVDGRVDGCAPTTEQNRREEETPPLSPPQAGGTPAPEGNGEKTKKRGRRRETWSERFDRIAREQYPHLC